MNPELIHRFDEYAKAHHYRLLNSVLIYKGDKIVLERYYNKFTENSRNNVKSIWKSILSICCGIAIDRGFIKNVDEPIATYLPVFDGRNNPYHSMITIKHLLTMKSGIYWNGGVKYHCPMLQQFCRTKDRLAYLADVKMDSLPGTKSVYKEWDVILLSAVLSTATGMNTFDFCNEFLYKPLGIESGRWFTFSDGLCYNIGTTPAEQAQSDLSARDLAKIGMLFKNGGKWNDEKIVSEVYVKEALTPLDLTHGHTLIKQGYGYMWWISPDGYGCSGYGGQQIKVIPKRDIVYVLQATVLSSHRDYNDVVNLIIDLL
ncbi:MAG: serine hydrolase [Clostridiales bacterium GWF2_38_85]|nr:MAG: serine hydrolase [Clostridiales bacterium GWF2_38_85]HBL84664.1 serine hydrolase [Clostridiales bacterium]